MYWYVYAGTSFQAFFKLRSQWILNDLLITFIDKTDLSNPLKQQKYGIRSLKTMAPFGVNIVESVWSIIILINDSVTVCIYLAFKSRWCFGLWFLDNGYIYWLFLLLHHMVWTFFYLISLQGVGFCFSNCSFWSFYCICCIFFYHYQVADYTYCSCF